MDGDLLQVNKLRLRFRKRESNKPREFVTTAYAKTYDSTESSHRVDKG
jgi:hypothetical protein